MFAGQSSAASAWRTIGIALATVALTHAQTAWAQHTLYVDAEATGSSDGLTWCSAFAHLQDAIATARTRNTDANPTNNVFEINVADGTYKPDRGISHALGDRTASFQLQNGVALRGGFAGCNSPNPNERNVTLYETILSGDLAGDDRPAPGGGTFADQCTEAGPINTGRSTFDTLDATTDGPGGSPCETDTTGDIWYVYTPLATALTRISLLGSDYDTILSIYTGASCETLSLVACNDDAFGPGSASQIEFTATSGITYHLRIGGWQGAVGSGFVDIVDRTNTIADNSYHVLTASQTATTGVLDGFVVTGGNANAGTAPNDRGGGMYLDNARPLVTGCTFRRNSANRGGGIATDGSDGSFTNCIFSSNSASTQGGGVYHYLSDPTMIACNFTDNSAALGAGMYVDSGTECTLTNCTFLRNLAGEGGGLRISSFNSRLTDCLIADNLATNGGGLYAVGNSQLIRCDVVRNTANQAGGGIYNKDFVDLVLEASTITNNYAHDGGGLYNSQYTSAVLTSCEIAGNRAYTNGGAMYNASSSTARVTDCMFRRNATVQPIVFSGANYGGGAVHNRGRANAKFTNCTFLWNVAHGSGGAVMNYEPFTESLFRDCSFLENESVDRGGAIYNSLGASTTFVECNFNKNISGTDGGAIANLDSSTALLTACAVVGNIADEDGGGVYNRAAAPVALSNCSLIANSAAQAGAVYTEVGNFHLSNCTMFGNSALDRAGGIRHLGVGSLEVRNSILWGNTDSRGAVQGSQLDPDGTVNTTATQSCVQGLGVPYVGNGNTGIDPVFVDPDGSDDVFGTLDDNLGLSPGSAAIDAGANASVGPDLFDLDEDGDVGERIPLDLTGNPRFVNDPATPDVGTGAPPLVDMGALEFLPDCNANEVFDVLDIVGGTSSDCDNNYLPDECEIDIDSTAPGGPFFCTLNCDPDCNNNGVPDECEVPQSCEPAVDCPVISSWVGEAGAWDNPPDQINWCLPESPNNNENAVFDVTIEGPDASVTLNTSPTIATLSLLDGATTVVNDSSGANVRTLSVDNSIFNSGVFRATDRERLTLDAPVIDQGGLCGEGGVLEATDGALGAGEENDKSIVEINGARVLGGIARTVGLNSEIHLIGGAELVDVCIDGVVVPDGQTGAFSGTVVNNDILAVRGTALHTQLLPASTDAVLDGAGCAQLTSQSFSRLGDLKAGFTNSPTHRIEGAGIIFGGLNNQGTVRADQVGQHLIVFPPGAKTNDGVFEAITGGTLRIADDVSGSGDYRAHGGTIRLTAPDDPTSANGTSLYISGDDIGRFGLLELQENTSLQLSGDVIIQPNGVFDALSGSFADVANLIVDGNAVPCSSPATAGITPPPKLRIRRAEVLVRAHFRILGAAVSSNSSDTGMSLGGDFDNQAICPEGFDWIAGSTVLNGAAPQVFEVAGKDLGPSILGFGTESDTNFAMGTLELAAGRHVTIVDNFDNDRSGQTPCTEALYVHQLILRSGVSMTLDNCHVYYESLIDEGATVNVFGCGGLKPLPTGDADGDGEVNLLDWNALWVCLHGPDHLSGEGCGVFDFDADSDVDLGDVRWFQRFFGTR